MRSSDSLLERAEAVAGAYSPETRLLKLAELRQAVDAAIVATLGEIEADPDPVHLDGSIDSGQWLATHSELHPAEAKSLANLALHLPAMPATDEALHTGRIGTEKARLLSTARQISSPTSATTATSTTPATKTAPPSPGRYSRTSPATSPSAAS